VARECEMGGGENTDKRGGGGFTGGGMGVRTGTGFEASQVKERPRRGRREGGSRV